jgi:quercetin dioxygenase-like cupin family protein
LAIKDTLRHAGKHCGVMATSNDNARQRCEQGFRAIGLGMDAGLLIRSLRDALAAVGRDRPLRASLTPVEPPPAPLRQPPASMRPDRSEVMNVVGSGPRVELERGVTLDCLVGAHNGARGLTTGQVTFAPEARLPYHTHPFSESITLLRGRVLVEVEGRAYELEPLDNVVVPRGVAHAVRNLSSREPAVLHVALASHQPTRTLVEPVFAKTGRPGAERVNRFRTAPRSAAGPNTEFVDCFNEELLPGLEMSGGHALFHPGGRLPAHLHDFDESICIIEGTAVCIVEGRRFSLADGATALVPRGRVHYFINETKETMSMLWVYAGPRPERIVVDERCATEEGRPW